MNKEKCLIYGGGGFIGSHLSEGLLDQGYDVSIFDKQNFSRKNISNYAGKIKILEGDFNNEIDILNSLREVDYVYHLVSSTLPATSNDNPIYDVETNLVSSLNLFKACIENKVKKLIFLSSGGTVYGIPDLIPIPENSRANPICSYGIIKKTIEEYLFMFEKLNGLDYFVFRLSNPYGERQNPTAAQGVIPVFINKVLSSNEIEIWGDGEVIRDYLYIKDAVKVLVNSLEIKSEERIINLSSGSGHSLNEIIEIIKNISEREIFVTYKKARSMDVLVNILDNSLARKIFNWKPEVDIERGIRLTYNYLKNNYGE